MRSLLKQLVSLPIVILDAIAQAYMSALSAIFPSRVPFWLDIQSRRIAARKSSTTHETAGRPQEFVFHTPNGLCQWRVNTFSTKEPETLEWIDQYGGDGVLFDIGANVGLYSIYYAKTKPGRVYAFEPSVFNLALLAKNINANQVQDKIRIVTNPLTAQNEFANFNLQVTDEGGALSAFGVEHGQDGKPLQKVLSYQTCGFSLDYLIEQHIVPDYPSLIKADVDGIEHLILRGARKTLAHPQCHTVLIEVHTDFEALSKEVPAILTEAGFQLTTRDSVNQIWVKPPTA
ncbi:FkbM family methyltransferase [Rhodoferax sp. TS-BS-61-7]|uniref:FkbM family methyltransferase n=1 Tax=Rhodoferax sp. TS-BS-61-7 TaxID=2094194 RepID=UPI000CF610A3|nr:FkbM family methyltransferase [Rhodoferax sp. TS-BS-61-7]PQA76623.1 FkbM family methyltransferase [Rhodoferax sp. TS-BS-61-7]